MPQLAQVVMTDVVAQIYYIDERSEVSRMDDVQVKTQRRQVKL